MATPVIESVLCGELYVRWIVTAALDRGKR